MPGADPRVQPASAVSDASPEVAPARKRHASLAHREGPPAYSAYEAGSAGHVYNEAAFRHFLDVDRRRAERATRPLLLVLVTVREPQGAISTLTDATAAAVFASLGECVREIDFVGWYREGKTPAAVLVQPTAPPGDIQRRMTDRIVLALRTHLPDDVMRKVRVRVVRLGGRK